MSGKEDAMRRRWLSRVVTLAGICGTVACNGDEEGSTGTDCVLGSQGCPCGDGDSCDDGLTCVDSVCVDSAAGGSGTAGAAAGGTGDSAAGEGGTGGQTGAAGEASGGSGGAIGGTGGLVVPVVPTPDDVDPQPAGPAAKIDLLFTIDNSLSMADKQEILELAIPYLINRLIDPVCIDSSTGDVTASSSAPGCPTGSEPEYVAVDDIHVGIITSSLGGQGGDICSPELSYFNETQNDRGRLISRDRNGASVQTWANAGFLAWDPSGMAHSPAGESDSAALISDFRSLVTGAGEQGCGYEATLEAWYRFLVDPEPPMNVVYDSTLFRSVPQGIDNILLAQRELFLRPNSVVAIVILTDEDDCSITDNGIGFLMGEPREGSMPRSTSVCDIDPNDECCLSCIQASWPSGCSDPQDDPNCQQGLLHEDVDMGEDRLNLRCFDQKRRFGLDLLHPIERYVDGLTSYEVESRTGGSMPNPLYAGSSIYPDATPRADSSRIFLAGIIGVPWQDIATDASLGDPTAIEYLSGDEISARGIWDDIVGDPMASPPVSPSDPFMIESMEPRSGTNPRTDIAISPPVAGPGGNPINGHEYQILDNGDLQYACIFPLATARECADVPPGIGCDCVVSNQVLDKPLCDGTTQVYAKAYPASRILQVLQGYGSNSVVASICPKNPSCADMSDVNCGYNPAMSLLLQRMKPVLRNP
jgi:hypothetical protein